MMPIIFRQEAEDDLRAISDWYGEVAPASRETVFADLYRSLDQLSRFPRSGMPVSGRAFRRIVTLKYHFKIAYHIESERIVVIGVFRYQNRDR